MNVFDSLNEQLLIIEQHQLETLANLRKKKKHLDKHESGSSDAHEIPGEFHGIPPWAAGVIADFNPAGGKG